MTTFLFILMLTVFLSYVSFIWIRYGVQKSISDSYYRLRPEKLGFIFTLFIMGFAYPAAVVAANVWITPAAFLIIVVGIARAFKDSKLLHTLHMIGAYGGVGLSMVGIWVYYHMWYVTIIFIIISGILFILNVKNKIWWVEILAFIIICIVLGLNL